MQIQIPFKKINVGKQKILPVFLPFMGCKNRCIFCSQHEQTGIDHQSIHHALNLLEQDLEQRLAKKSAAVELGFFGGTFTLLPHKELQDCLNLVKHYMGKKIVNSARCSTRPDALNDKVLDSLKAAGFDKIELGVQSFNDTALKKAERGYTGQVARDACTKIVKSGFKLGVQLLPGMPALDTKIFEQDVQEAINCGADFLRFYPCLVIKGTKLAELWANGLYKPWDFDDVLNALSTGYIMAQKANVPIIRIGLAPENSLKQNILDGVFHDSLGAIVQANVLYSLVTKALQNAKIKELYVPLWCQGFFWGHQKNMTEKWLKLGVHANNIKWHNSDVCIIKVRALNV